jgi:bacterial/archaeal transporter family protein
LERLQGELKGANERRSQPKRTPTSATASTQIITIAVDCYHRSQSDRTNRTLIMGLSDTPAWLVWAFLSACFASLTAIFAKIGLEGIDSDFATLVRTVVILCVLTGFVAYAGKWSNPFDLRPRTVLFLVLSGLATGASWVCYFRALKIGDASRVAPIDKLSVVLVAVFAVTFLGERPTVRDWLGILLVGAGVVVLALKR